MKDKKPSNGRPRRGYREPTADDLKSEYWYPLVNRVLLLVHPVVNRDRMLQRLVERRRQALGLSLVAGPADDFDERPEAPLLDGYIPLVRDSLLVHEVPIMRFATVSEPVVSIIMLTWNQWPHTAKCLDSLLKYTMDVPYELIMVDNASQDETIELYERKIMGAIVIRNESNIGFSRACNQGAEIARGRYLMFLNNDTVLTPGWLAAMITCAESADDIGIVGSRIVQMDGNLQEAGGVVWSDGSCSPYGLWDDPLAPDFNFTREVDYVSGCSLLIKRDLFDRVGRFDTAYSPAYYEDVDLCLAVRAAGQRIIYEPKSMVFHFGSASAGSERAVELQLRNRETLKQKWAAQLARQPDHGMEPNRAVFGARQRRHGKRILFIDDCVPQFDRGSGFPRSWEALHFLADAGHHVTLVPVDMQYREPYASTLQARGIEVFYGAVDLNAALKKRVPHIDLVIISRPHNFKRFYDALRKLGFKRIVYDCEALFYVRLERQLAFLTDAAKLADTQLLYEDSLATERRAFRSCDAVLSISEAEATQIRQDAPKANVYVMPPLCRARTSIPSFEARSGILFVGGFLAGPGSPNEDAVLWLVSAIWPAVREKLGADVKLYIVGSDPTLAVKALASADVEVIGYARDLEVWYDRCRIHVVPIRFGAGVKLKVTEGLSHGIPTVATTCGAEGLLLRQGESGFVTDNPAAFAAHVVELYANEQMWLRLSRASLELAHHQYGEQAVRNKLLQLVEEISV